ncbi:hypothetical protein KUF71_017416 [Frankliniella fusca]|uniref:Uncharacterized protein n=1 Tax=Frankliniella fusca TaxID=407009 RepID=A0AAE1LVK1_9NEOP|nr:hypothetical protein KUF71_017416 [Frankliniella fusca]
MRGKEAKMLTPKKVDLTIQQTRGKEAKMLTPKKVDLTIQQTRGKEAKMLTPKKVDLIIQHKRKIATATAKKAHQKGEKDRKEATKLQKLSHKQPQKVKPTIKNQITNNNNNLDNNEKYNRNQQQKRARRPQLKTTKHTRKNMHHTNSPDRNNKTDTPIVTKNYATTKDQKPRKSCTNCQEKVKKESQKTRPTNWTLKSHQQNGEETTRLKQPNHKKPKQPKPDINNKCNISQLQKRARRPKAKITKHTRKNQPRKSCKTKQEKTRKENLKTKTTNWNLQSNQQNGTEVTKLKQQNLKQPQKPKLSAKTKLTDNNNNPDHNEKFINSQHQKRAWRPPFKILHITSTNLGLISQQTEVKETMKHKAENRHHLNSSDYNKNIPIYNNNNNSARNKEDNITESSNNNPNKSKEKYDLDLVYNKQLKRAKRPHLKKPTSLPKAPSNLSKWL